MGRQLRLKALKQLMLLVKGISYRNEYIGWCEQRYYVGRLDNAIVLLPYATVC